MATNGSALRQGEGDDGERAQNVKNIYDRLNPIKNKSTHHLRAGGQNCILVCILV